MRSGPFIIFSLLLLAFGISFKLLDFIIISLLILIFLFIDYSRIRKPGFYLRPVLTYFELPRKGEYDLIFYFEGKREEVEFLPPFNFSSFLKNKNLVLKLKPNKSGIYEINEVRVKKSSLFFQKEFSVIVNPPVKFSVYPISILKIGELLSYISAIGYNLPSRLLGPGEEYAYSDELREGDELRSVDWKKTAKTGKIMVKRYYWDLFGGSLVILDLEATDENSADDIAVEAVNALRYSYNAGSKIYYYNGEKIEDLGNNIYKGIIYVIDMLKRYYPEYSRVLDYYGKKIEEGKIVLNQESQYGKVIIVTQLLSDVIYKVGSISGNGGIIIQPSKPWVYIDDIEISYTIRKRYEINMNYAKNNGYEIYSSFNEVLGGINGKE